MQFNAHHTGIAAVFSVAGPIGTDLYAQILVHGCVKGVFHKPSAGLFDFGHCLSSATAHLRPPLVSITSCRYLILTLLAYIRLSLFVRTVFSLGIDPIFGLPATPFFSLNVVVLDERDPSSLLDSTSTSLIRFLRDVIGVVCTR